MYFILNRRRQVCNILACFVYESFQPHMFILTKCVHVLLFGSFLNISVQAGTAVLGKMKFSQKAFIIMTKYKYIYNNNLNITRFETMLLSSLISQEHASDAPLSTQYISLVQYIVKESICAHQ